jgi:DNA polymerase-3 subunit delta
VAKSYLTYSELRNKLEAGDIRPLYLFQGEEEFLMEEAIDLLKEKVLGSAASDFNFEKFYGKETKATDILSSAETTPFLSPRRFLLVKDADLFPPADLDALADYAIKPNPATCLVLTAKKIDTNRKAFWEAWKTHGEIVQFWKLFENEVPKWIQQRAKKYNLSMPSEASLYLYERVGNDLRQLDQELEKIHTFLGPGQEVSRGVLENLSQHIRQYSVFDLVESLSQKKLDQTFKILDVLLREGEEPLKILALIARQIRLLWQVKLARAEGKSSAWMEKEWGIPARHLKNLQEQEKNFSLDCLKKTFTRLSETDIALKSSLHTPRILLESLILDLII